MAMLEQVEPPVVVGGANRRRRLWPNTNDAKRRRHSNNDGELRLGEGLADDILAMAENREMLPLPGSGGGDDDDDETGGGSVLFENESGVVAVPERLDKKRRVAGYSATGDRLCQSGPPTRPMKECTEKYRKKLQKQALRSLREARARGEDLSELMVRLYLVRRFKHPTDIDDVMSRYRRCESLPSMPPFRAFDVYPPERKSLTEKRGSASREFPVRVAWEYVVIDDESSIPSIADISALDSSRRSKVFFVPSCVTPRDKGYRLALAPDDVHVFNSLAAEMVALSGLFLGADGPLPPVHPDFAVSCFCRNGESAFSVPLRAVDTGILGDAKVGGEEDAKVMAALARELASLQLPSIAGAVPSEFRRDDGTIEHSEGALDAVMGSLSGTFGPALSEACEGRAWLVRDAALLARGYAEYRYYYLRDIVAGCLAVDRMAIDPDQVSCTLRCSGDRIFPRRSCDPLNFVMFWDLSDDFDRYGTCLLLYRLVCEGECVRRSRLEQRGSPSAGGAGEKKRRRGRPSAASVAADIERGSMVGIFMSDVASGVAAAIVPRIDSIYRIRMYSDLAGKYVTRATPPSPPPAQRPRRERPHRLADLDPGELVESLLGTGRSRSVVVLMPKEKITDPGIRQRMEDMLRIYDEDVVVVTSRIAREVNGLEGYLGIKEIANHLIEYERSKVALGSPPLPLITVISLVPFIQANRKDLAGIALYPSKRQFLFNLKEGPFRDFVAASSGSPMPSPPRPRPPVDPPCI